MDGLKLNPVAKHSGQDYTRTLGLGKACIIGIIKKEFFLHFKY